jgi:four helix bundle protein
MFSHEKLDVYRLAIQYAGWSFRTARELRTAYRHSRDQLLRASQSIALNIAEGNGRVSEADRRHFFEIARGSALECAAIQDVLEVCGGIQAKKNLEGKDMLDRLAAMLTKIGGRGYTIKEDFTTYEETSE